MALRSSVFILFSRSPSEELTFMFFGSSTASSYWRCQATKGTWFPLSLSICSGIFLVAVRFLGEFHFTFRRKIFRFEMNLPPNLFANSTNLVRIHQMGILHLHWNGKSSERMLKQTRFPLESLSNCIHTWIKYNKFSVSIQIHEFKIFSVKRFQVPNREMFVPVSHFVVLSG